MKSYELLEKQHNKSSPSYLGSLLKRLAIHRPCLPLVRLDRCAFDVLEEPLHGLLQSVQQAVVFSDQLCRPSIRRQILQPRRDELWLDLLKSQKDQNFRPSILICNLNRIDVRSHLQLYSRIVVEMPGLLRLCL